MSITVSNIQHNHRAVYGEFTGDGATTAIPIPLAAQYGGQPITGVATVTTAPSSFTHRSSKGGFLFPHGTDAAIASATVASGVVTINTSAAVGNGTKAYVAFVFNTPTARG
jgi:hypothetical protein